MNTQRETLTHLGNRLMKLAKTGTSMTVILLLIVSACASIVEIGCANTGSSNLGLQRDSLNFASSNQSLSRSDLQQINLSEFFYIIEMQNDKTRIDVKDFGAKGDGISDDSLAIQNAIASLPKDGGTLFFPPGVYIQGDGTGAEYAEDGIRYSEAENRDIRFIFSGYRNVHIVGNGAVIRAHPQNPSTEKHAGFIFEDCVNFVVEGITYDGQLDVRPKIVTGDKAAYNKQHGFAIRAGSKNMLFWKVTATKSMMDGFLVGSNTNYPENIVFKECIATYNYRQGLTVGSAIAVKVLGGEYSYTGKIKGTLPMHGIDFEANGNAQNFDCYVKGASFIQNEGVGISIHNGTNNIVVEDNYFSNCGILVDAKNGKGGRIANNKVFITQPNKTNDAALALGHCEDLTIVGNYIETAGNYSVRSTTLSKNKNKVSVINNTFVGKLNDPNRANGQIRLLGFNNLTFKGNKIVDAFSGDKLGGNKPAVLSVKGEHSVLDNLVSYSSAKGLNADITVQRIQ